MSAFAESSHEDVWTKIEREKRRDRMVRRISIVAWTVTLVVLLIYTVMVGVKVYEALELMAVGVVGPQVVINVLTPLVAVVGIISLLIAVLSTVGVFLRLRTASLSEIQMRLAALENILLTQSSSEGDDLAS